MMYEAPATRGDARPSVIVWFRVYAVTMAVLWAAAAWAATPALAILAVFYAGSSLLPLRRWAWTVALVAIAIGLPSITIVVALPLLRAWFAPVTRAAFGRPPI
jgi:hypothetical protein